MLKKMTVQTILESLQFGDHVKRMIFMTFLALVKNPDSLKEGENLCLETIRIKETRR